ncbi:hypothetical protein J8TS2_11870 [Lederbergia ruris]|uniref:Uncharacterized protein n=1 Tax=Lederbergia ruris TaxID=217495 RepID=A0ABQ4KFW8_9BACI|nr:hypothetical protein J8TS2_11870 [Lederbergia ruris]
MFKKEDKKDPSAKGADVLSATPTLAHPVRRKFEAAQPSSSGEASQRRNSQCHFDRGLQDAGHKGVATGSREFSL